MIYMAYRSSEGFPFKGNTAWPVSRDLPGESHCPRAGITRHQKHTVKNGPHNPGLK